jgi:hypothetical protein
MKIKHFLIIGTVPMALFAAAACTKTTDREPELQPAAGPLPGTANGVSDISSARCEREVRCGNVGPGEDYESSEQCVSQLNADGYSELSAEACPSGLDQPQISKCLSAIRAEECNSPMDSLERLVDCRSAALCRD